MIKETYHIGKLEGRGSWRTYWRAFSNTIGSSMQMGDVWGMIRKMVGERKEWGYLILNKNNQLVVTDWEKVELLCNSLLLEKYTVGEILQMRVNGEERGQKEGILRR